MKNPLKIAICEDQHRDAALLLDYISQIGISAICETFSCCEKLLASYTIGCYDIIFMDICMEGVSGVEAVSIIRQIDENVIIAFTTASLDYTLESYRLGVLKYLEKPVSQKEVRNTMELAIMKRHSTAHISIMINGCIRQISTDIIVYFEQQNHAVSINTLTGILRTSQNVKLSQIEPLLSFPPFLRCHHSYIVNLRYAERLDKDLRTFNMKTGSKVYIRKQDLKNAAQAYEDYLFEAARRGEP